MSRDFSAELTKKKAHKKYMPSKPEINLDLTQLQEPTSGMPSTSRRVVLNKGSSRVIDEGVMSMKVGAKILDSQEEVDFVDT